MLGPWDKKDGLYCIDEEEAVVKDKEWVKGERTGWSATYE